MDGAELKAWRKRRGWTQVELAEELGVSSGTVSHWEINLQNIPPYLDKLLKAWDRLDEIEQMAQARL